MISRLADVFNRRQTCRLTQAKAGWTGWAAFGTGAGEGNFSGPEPGAMFHFGTPARRADRSTMFPSTCSSVRCRSTAEFGPRGNAILPRALQSWGIDNAWSGLLTTNRGVARQMAETTLPLKLKPTPYCSICAGLASSSDASNTSSNEVIRRDSAFGVRHELTQMIRELDDIEQKHPPVGC